MRLIMTQNDQQLGKSIHAISVGDTFSVTESFKERDVLLYMGVTGDSNPAYLKQAQKREMDTVLPPIALMGVITRTVSMNFPGPGARLVEMNMNVSKPIPHNSTISFDFEVIRVEELKQFITIHVIGYHTNQPNSERVLDVMLTVLPPEENLDDMTNKIDAGVFQRISGGETLDY